MNILQHLYLRSFPNTNKQFQEKTGLPELELLLSGSKLKLLLQQGWKSNPADIKQVKRDREHQELFQSQGIWQGNILDF